MLCIGWHRTKQPDNRCITLPHHGRTHALVGKVARITRRPWRSRRPRSPWRSRPGDRRPWSDGWTRGRHKKHYSLIARELHTTPEEVRAAEKRISALDPCPGRSFQPAEPTLYVRPDLFIAELDGKLQVILNDYYLPRVSISQYYVRLLKESDEPETRASRLTSRVA